MGYHRVGGPASKRAFYAVIRQDDLKGRFPLATALRACRQHFMAAGLFSALLNILYLAPTLYMLQVYDRVVSTRGAGTLAFLTIIFVIAVVTLSLLDYARTILLARASVRLDRLLAGQIIAALISQVKRNKTAQVLREFDTMRVTMTSIGVLAVFDAPWTPIYIAICFIIHPALGVLALTSSVILLSLAFLNERATKRPIERATEAGARSYTSIDFSVHGAGVLRALGMRTDMIRRHLHERGQSTHLSSESTMVGARFTSLTKSLRLLIQSLSLGLGAYLAIEQKISAGSIFAASLLVTRALAPIEQIVGAWRSGIQARVAYKSLTELFDDAPIAQVHTHLPAPKGRIELEKVYILSPGGERPLVSDVSLTIEVGETIGVVGPSGAGKSTLVRAIGGAVQADSGSIRFDGADAKDWNSEQLARYVGYMPQDPNLFRGTVKENISRFVIATDEQEQEEIDAEVIRAAQLVGTHEVVLRLPNGYDTMLGNGGTGLSAGQAQRVALARSVYGSPAVVVMDEPNAHLDTEGEADLLSAIYELKCRGVTVIVVAHRTGVLAAVDRLMVVRDGRISLFGPRDEVVQRLNAPTPPRAVQSVS